MKLKTASLLATLAVVALPFTASAEGLSFNIGAVSLYKSNGVDQNSAPKDDKNFYPALQGGVDYSFSNGFYVGNWNSTGKFDDANVEIDLYGGFKGELTKDLSVDVGFARFIYPNAASWNANEAYLGFTSGPLGLKIVRGLTTGANRGDMRFAFSYERALTDALGMKLTYGIRDLDNGNDFNDYALGLTYDLGDSLAVSGTFSGATGKTGNDARKNRLTFGVSKGF